jgi:uncharacterized membrane protein SpoIIM required for sporulation
MGIGVSIFLIAIGAILSFAVNVVVPHANLFVIGIILMCVGALGLLMDLVIFAPRRRRYPADGYPADQVYEERRLTRDRY